jgi:hypothetical protein
LLDPEPPADRSSQVREALPDAEGCGLSATYSEKRDALAGVVRSSVGRVVAVVSGNDEDVFIGEGFEQLRPPLVEAFQVSGHTLRVAAVAELGIEVHEVGEDQAALKAAKSVAYRVDLSIVVRRGGKVLGNTLAVEDVPDLADRNRR